MPLSPTARGLLDQYIDSIIKEQVPIQIKLFRLPKVKAGYHIQNENDFVFGAAYGAILAGFNGIFIATFQRAMTEEESEEMIDVIDKRIAEIREEIFKAG